MDAADAGTSGGRRGLNGAQRRILLGFVAIFLAVVALILVANAESSIADLAAAGASIPAHLVWSWEWTSMIGWLSLYPLLWWAVARLRPPRVPWPAVVAAAVLGSLAASAWHIGMMVALRHLYYAATGEGTYRFDALSGNRLLYEYRKDVATYLQFVAMAAVVQWLIARAATIPVAGPADAPRLLAVADGAVTHRLPVAEIEQATAAGNYVELRWQGRPLLHRATLAAVEAELGGGFVRIHRSRLVRRDAVRRVTVDKSGDFTVTLASGEEARGSRRYRAALDTA